VVVVVVVVVVVAAAAAAAAAAAVVAALRRATLRLNKRDGSVHMQRVRWSARANVDRRSASEHLARVGVLQRTKAWPSGALVANHATQSAIEVARMASLGCCDRAWCRPLYSRQCHRTTRGKVSGQRRCALPGCE
jgi:hypothetical protein